MAITFNERFIREMRKGVNTPNVIIEVELDGGTVLWGFHGRGSSPMLYFPANGTYKADGTIFAYGCDELYRVSPVLNSISSLQNKLDPKSGYSTRGQLSFVISGKENFIGLIRDEHLKNRKASRKDGFVADGFAYHDYATTFRGRITDWSRNGDELTVIVSDELINASRKIPVENQTKTQSIDFRNLNPADIMKDVLLNGLGIEAASVNTAAFEGERDLWLNGWRFDRVITEPKEANEYLNELQTESNSFLLHDGEKISYKVFAPPAPGNAVEEWNDTDHILEDSFSIKSGYRDNFYNRVVVYFDYDESGSDREENFESVVISADAASQSPSQWNEVKSRVVKCKWVRTFTYSYGSNITGLTIYHVSRANGAGSGTLTYNRADNTLQWSAPGGSPGEAVKVANDGKYQLFDSDKSKYIRAVISAGGLPLTDKTDAVSIVPLGGERLASTLATKLMNRYRDPAAAVSFELDINNLACNSEIIKPSDIKDITTVEACGKGRSQWERERVMLTSVRPDFSGHRISIEGIETKMHRRYGFIAPPGLIDYAASTAAQREYAFIGDASNKVNGGTADGYYIW